MTRIYTHSNTFHPDELLAIVLLQSTVLAGQAVSIVRTRETSLLRAAQADSEVFVIDVGFVYDPTHRNFDHHQHEMTEGWPDGTPYSACGLIWKWLRVQGMLKSFGDDLILDELEERLIRPADRYDNGLGGAWGDGEFLSAYNRSSKNKVVGRIAFDRALQVAGELLANIRVSVEKDMRARKTIQEAMLVSLSPEGILVIPEHSSDQYAHWAAKLSNGAVNLIIVPRSNGLWTVITTPRDISDPFSCKTPAPASWRGRSAFEVAVDKTGVVILFCHKTGFLTVVEGTLDQALGVARLICLDVHGIS